MAKTLIAYFSHTGENYFGGQIRSISKGNTADAAEFAQKAVGGDLFEIRTVKDYPVNYKQCTDIAAEEGRMNARPELRGTLPDMSGYNTIITKYAVLYKDIHFQKRHGCHRNQIYIHVHLVASSFSLRKTRYCMEPLTSCQYSAIFCSTKNSQGKNVQGCTFLALGYGAQRK